MRRSILVVILMVMLCTSTALAATPVDISGYWSLKFEQGNGYMILAKSDTNAQPIYTGKIVVHGVEGESTIRSGVTPESFMVGKTVFFEVQGGRVLELAQFIYLDITGGSVMPGKMRLNNFVEKNTPAYAIQQNIQTFTAIHR